jgi:threonine synthase
MTWKLTCTECGAHYDERDVRYVCPVCAEAQCPGDSTRGVLEVEWDVDALRAGWSAYLDDALTRGLERVRPLLPLSDRAPVLPLVVGDTPMCAVPLLRENLGLPNLWVKDDTRNPSASYKDRASALVCLKAAEYGESVIVAASTGNAATALSCMAASLGQRAVILVPASAPRAKLVQMLCYGAQVVPVQGSYDQAFELSLEATRLFGWYNRNTAYNPFTIEGKKTAALEVVRDLGGRSPDAVVIPTGDGVILSGIAKGFRDLVRAGVIARVPKLISVQAAGSAAIANAIREGRDLKAVPGAKTVADSICVDAPRAGLLAVREIRASGGHAVVVEDAAIVQAIAELARLGGVFAEPAAAAALAGLHVAMQESVISANDEIVLMITGHGLKDVATASGSIEVPEAIRPDTEALRERLEQAGTA